MHSAYWLQWLAMPSCAAAVSGSCSFDKVTDAFAQNYRKQQKAA